MQQTTSSSGGANSLQRHTIRMSDAEPGRNQAMRRKSHQRLNALTEQAEEDNFYGTVGIEVTFEAGRITTVRHKIEGTDKP